MVDLLAALLAGDHAAVRDRLADPAAVIEQNGRRPLSIAAERGDLPMIDLLVDLGAPLDAGDATPLGYPALTAAVRADEVAAVERLLALGADVGAGDSIRGTALHHAAVGGQAGLARLLIDAGAGVDATDGNGATPLVRLAVHADRERSGFATHGAAIASVLGTLGVAGFEDAAPGATPATHPLHAAHLATADVLLRAGADPDVVADDGYSALHHAAGNGALALIDRLLAGGAKPGLQNGIGYAPLHAACDERRVDAVRALLAAGADPDPADEYGFSPLHGAAIQGSAGCAGLLVDAGADRNRRTLGGYDKVTAGMTPADAAAAYGHDDLAALLR